MKRTYYYGATTPQAFPFDYYVVPSAEITLRYARDASPVGRAVVQALVADVGTGRILGEIHPRFTRVSWLLNNYGEAEMVFAADDAAVDSLITPGRRLILRFDNGLPDWGGVLDVPIDYDGLTVGIRAFEAMYLLKSRVTGRNVTINTDAGTAAQALLDAANLISPTGITVDFKEYVDGSLNVDYHYTPIWDALTKDIAPYIEWVLRPGLGEAGLSFRLIIAPEIGEDRSETVLFLQGVNMQRPQVIEQGPIVNEWVLASSQGDWPEDADNPREVVVGSDQDSAYKYGLRQGVQTISQTSTTNLTTLAAQALADSVQPYTALSAVVLNMPPAKFGQYWIGDWVTVELAEGYRARRLKKQIIGIEFSVENGTCEVILR